MTDTAPAPLFDLPTMLDAAAAGQFQAFLKSAHGALEEPAWTALANEALKAHHVGDFDLLAALDEEDGPHLNYPTQRFIELALPALTITMDDMLALIVRLSARTRGNALSHYIQNGFAEWMMGQDDRAAAAHTALLSGAGPAGLLPRVLHTGLRQAPDVFLPEVIKLLQSGTDEQCDTAAGLLGRFESFTPTQQQLAIASLEEALRISTGPQVKEPLRGLLATATRLPGAPEVGLRALKMVAPHADADVREAVATAMMFEITKATDPLAVAALAILHGTQKDEAVTTDAIDHILSHDLKDRLQIEQDRLLDDLLARRAVTMKKLGSVARALMSGDAARFGAVIKRWLTSEEIVHVLGVRDLCESAMEKALAFDLDFSDVSELKATRVARRSCALLVLHPETVGSILVSLLRTGPAGAHAEVERLLFDPLLISYWGSARTYLEGVLPAVPQSVADVIARALARHDRYKAAIEAVQGIQEMRPSQHQRYLRQTLRREEQRAIHKASQKGSFFANLFPTSILLYGDSAIYDVHVSDEETVRQETPMQSQEFSLEIPRLEVIDPFGSWYQRELLLREDNAL